MKKRIIKKIRTSKEKIEMRVLKEFNSLWNIDIERILRMGNELERELFNDKCIWLRCVKQGYKLWIYYLDGGCIEEDFSELEEYKIEAYEKAGMIFLYDCFEDNNRDWLDSLDGEFSSIYYTEGEGEPLYL